jgi:hypothetical protein
MRDVDKSMAVERERERVREREREREREDNLVKRRRVRFRGL